MINSEMDALVITANGKIEIQKRKIPTPRAREVLLRVRACGLCSSDRTRAFFNGAYHYPLIAGHEIAGETVRLGSEVPEEYMGLRAAVFPLLPCGRCEACEKGQYAMCSNYDYLGSRRDGGFQEYVCVPTFNLVPLPEDMEYRIAALLEPAAVAVHAASLAGIRKSDSVALIGTGTVAILAAMYCRYLGVERVTLVGRNEEKIDWIRRKIHLSAVPPGMIAEPTDVVLECVGSRESVLTAIMAARPRGRIALVGNPDGDIDIPRDIYWKILRKELSVCGSWNSTYGGRENDWTKAVEFLTKCGGSVSPVITETFSLVQGVHAFEKLREGRKVIGKLMITVDGEFPEAAQRGEQGVPENSTGAADDVMRRSENGF